MIGFASRFALHTLRRMVVLPAFALPMTRMRNWGHRRRISAGPKAPSLDGRTLLDDWLSADMGGEQECSEFEDQVVVRDKPVRALSQESCFLFQTKSKQQCRVTFILLPPSQGCANVLARKAWRLTVTLDMPQVRHSKVVHHTENPARQRPQSLATLDDSYESPNNLGWPLVSFSFPCLPTIFSPG